MKIVQINSVCGSGSTGKICVAISEMLTKRGIENYIFYASGNSDYPLGKQYMSSLEIKIQALKSRLLGNYGFQSKRATKRLIKELEKISPDIVHLHNLHGHNVHLGLLFTFLKENKIKVFWTFHDCWAFTAYCPHYDMIGCNQWKTGGCHACPQKNHYSWFFDRSKQLFSQKKELFCGLALTIITPSQWLADQVKASFLKECRVKVINNGIDLSVFRPRKSNFRKKYNLEDKIVLLGVAFDWGIRKGLDAFIELSKSLDDRFKMVLVGTNEIVDKQLPGNIISIHRTRNQIELAEIYSSADLFVNLTREETYPTVNMEAIACGTPVMTFRAGGSPEMIDDTCGVVVEKDNIKVMIDTITKVCSDGTFDRSDCVKIAGKYDNNQRLLEYIETYVC
ncbi:MAG: glycosyltransferase [Clostridia bacterium]|nr:glycosyltransferase [Clostridia bacterium]